MKKLLFLLAAIASVATGAMLSTVDVKAQCNGVFPNNTVCGNVSGLPAPPAVVPATAISSGGVGGSTSQIQFNNNGSFGGVTSSVVGTGGTIDALVTSASSTTARLMSVRFADPINVKDYGAAGNGTTDDTTAINAAIAKFNSNGVGVLYFPRGTYKVTTALAPVSASGLIKGDGGTNLSNQINGLAPSPATTIQETSNSVALFTVTAQGLSFQDIAMQNTSGSVPIAGSVGILANSGVQLTATAPTPTTSPTLTFASVPVTVASPQSVYDVTTAKAVGTVSSVASPTVTLTGNASNAVSTNDVVNFGGITYQETDYQNVQVSGFYIGIDIKTGASWTAHNIDITAPVLYGIRVNNVVNTDAGDWSIVNSSFYTINSGGAYSGATSAIRIEGSGGGKITNVKINCGFPCVGFTNGIDAAPVPGATQDLMVSNSSIENFTSYGIIATGSYPGITITGIQFYTNSAISAIKIINNRGTSISGITLLGTYTGTGIDSTASNRDMTVSGVSWPASVTFGSGGPVAVTENDNVNVDNVGTDIGMGAGVRVAGAVASGNNFPGSMGLSSNGRTDFWINTQAGQQAAVTYSTGSTPSWRTYSESSSNTFHIWRGGGVNDVMLFNNAAHANHVGGAAPTIAGGCGGTSSIVAGNDATAFVTGQNTSVTSCIVQFGTAYSTAPTCIASGNQAPLTNNIGVSTTSITVHFAGATSFTWSYHCFGQ